MKPLPISKQIDGRGSDGFLNLAPLVGAQIGGDLGSIGSVVVAGPGFFGRFVEGVLDAGVVDAGQFPDGDGELDLPWRLCVDAERDSEQTWRAANW